VKFARTAKVIQNLGGLLKLGQKDKVVVHIFNRDKIKQDFKKVMSNSQLGKFDFIFIYTDSIGWNISVLLKHEIFFCLNKLVIEYIGAVLHKRDNRNRINKAKVTL